MHHRQHRRMTDEYKKELEQINKHPTLKRAQIKEAATSIDVANAFKNKKSLRSGSHFTNGQVYKLFGKTIAEHTEKGLRITNAGYDTPTTYRTLNQLGINSQIKGGVIHINNKPYKHGTFVTIPYNEVSKDPITQGLGKRGEGESGEIISRLRDVRKRSMEKYNSLSQTSIQPSEQRKINAITGVKSPIGKSVRATAAHHILYRRNVPGMQFNINNLIPLDRKSHSEAHRFDRLKMSAEELTDEEREQRGKSIDRFADFFEQKLHEQRMKELQKRPYKPRQKDRNKIISAKLAALRSSTNSTVNRLNLLKRRSKKMKMAQIHIRGKEVSDYILQHHGLIDEPKGPSFITQEGKLIGHFGTHYDVVRELGDRVEINLKKDINERPTVDDSDIHEFLKRTGLIRVQSFPQAQQISLHIPFRMTNAQLKTVDDLSKHDPNLEIGYGIGEDFNKMGFGKGTVRELLREHAKQFGKKVAQAEGATNVFNMTYDKSKPTKVKKKRLTLDDKILKYSLSTKYKYRRDI